MQHQVRSAKERHGTGRAPLAARLRLMLPPAVSVVVMVAAAGLVSSAYAAQAHCGQGGGGCVPASFATGGEGAGQLTLASGSAQGAGSGAAVDNTTGNVYVADTGNHRVDEFDSAGVFTRAWGWGVATGASELQTCTSSCRRALSGSAAGEFELPVFVGIDQSDGDVYVADTGDNLVTKFTEAGALVTGWGNNGVGESPNGQLNGTLAQGPFGALAGIAVDAGSNLWVYVGGTAKLANVHMYEFSGAGAFEQVWEPQHVNAGSYSPQGIAVDTSGHIFVSENAIAAQELTSTGEWLGPALTAPVSALSVDPSDADLYVAETDVIADVPLPCETTGAEECTPSARFGLGAVTGISGAAVNASTGTVYALDAAKDDIVTFKATLEAHAEAPGSVTATTATLNGTANPKGEVITRCTFQYGETTQYDHVAPCSPEQLGTGNGPVAVHADISELTGGRTYHYRLRAVNANHEEVKTADATMPTLTVATIEATATSGVTASTAVVGATVNPKGIPDATCVVQYGTSMSYGTTVPCEPASLGSGNAGVPVSRTLEGLSPATTYHWRLVVTDANGVSVSVDNSFVDLDTSEIVRDCPNEDLREQSARDSHSGAALATELPDCRAYEMVSPTQKNAALLTPVLFGIAPQLANNGQSLIVPSIQCFGNPGSCTGDRASKGPPFEFTRSSSGWVTRTLAPPAGGFELNTVWGYDATTGVVLYSSPVESGSDEFYARSSEGAFDGIGPIAERQPFTAITSSPLTATASVDHVLFESDLQSLWAFDGSEGKSVYEYADVGASAPLLVGVSGGAGSHDVISACGTNIASLSGTNTREALSADGRIVYFTADGPCAGGLGANASKAVPANELYARIAGETAEAHTVRISERSGSECSEASCINSPPASPFLEGVSEDGPIAAFTSTQKLMDSASEDSQTGDSAGAMGCVKTRGSNGCNLYLYDLNRPAGERLIDVSRGDSSGLGPQVQGLMALSPDGTRAYFVAKGVLTSSANRYGEVPIEGADNLYVARIDAEHPNAQVKFIATLPGASGSARSEFAEPTEWSQRAGVVANVTTDGNVLVFTSHGALTSDTTRTEGPAQVFRYDAEAEELKRISVGERGFNDNGNLSAGEARVALDNGNVGPRRRNPTMSDDGSYVFFQSPAALVPRALDDVSVNGRSESPSLAQNIYEWEEAGKGGCEQESGCVHLISDGRDASEINNGGPRVTYSSVELLGTDTTGENVFFTTVDPLVKQDTDTQLDIYDARVDGGFPAPSAEAQCQGEECRVPSSPSPVFAPLGSTSFSGSGNLVVPLVKPAAKPTVTAPTRAQKLSKALKQCRTRRNKQKRSSCERQARKKYGPKPKKKKSKAKAKSKANAKGTNHGGHK